MTAHGGRHTHTHIDVAWKTRYRAEKLKHTITAKCKAG